MASGDVMFSAEAHANLSPAWLYVAFTSGSVEPAKGDTIWGDTSNANAVLELIVTTSGTWGGGDAAGWMFLSQHNGTAWTSGENWTKNTTTAANNGTLTLTPSAAYATLDLARGDTPVLDFDSTSNEVALFAGVLPDNYDGGGLTFTVGVASTTATGDMSFGIALKSYTDDVDNFMTFALDPSTLKVFAEPNYNTAIDAASVAGEIKYFQITFINGADMDSIAAGEYFQVLLFRDAQDTTNDDMAADASFVFIHAKET